MLGIWEINDYVLLSIDVDPQEEDAEKSLDFFLKLYAFILFTSTLFDDISEFRFNFFTAVLTFVPLIQESVI